jgi:hypothetical protein
MSPLCSRGLVWLGLILITPCGHGCGRSSGKEPIPSSLTPKTAPRAPEQADSVDVSASGIQKIEAANPDHVKRNGSGDIVRISLSSKDACDEAIERISSCPTVEEVSITCSTRVTPGGLLPLLQFPKLRALALSVPGLNIPEELIRGLGQSHTLESASFNYVFLSTAAVRLLPGLNQLTRLQLFHAGIRPDDIPQIAKIPHLEYLDLSSNGLSEHDLAPLASLKQLRVLRAADVHISPETEGLFKEAIVSGKSE